MTGSKTYNNYVNGTPEAHSRFVQTLGTRYCFAGEYGCSKQYLAAAFNKDSTFNDDIDSRPFGRCEGVLRNEEHESDAASSEGEEEAEEDRIQIRMGYFCQDSSIPPKLVQGTYTTARTRITAQQFTDGPVVKEGTGAAFHDLETGNVRWAKLGATGVGPIGKALFVFANASLRARVETYQAEGALSGVLNLL
jgi:hypothetical protein